MARGRLLLTIAIVVSLVRARDGSEDGTSCNGPSITKVNFQYYIEILNGTNRTLSCEIRSDTPLKEELIWRKGSSRLPTDIKYSVENSSCSNSSNQTCIVSNLTLINAVRYKDSSPYVGNYTLTAENDCGIATVYVYVDIYVPPSCEDDYSKPPQLKIPPPSVIQAVKGHDVTITARYDGNKDDKNLGVYWCVFKTQEDYYCYYLNENDNYTVSIDGCLPDDKNCCYFTVTLKIKEVTHDLTLQSMVVWQQDPHSFIPGNSSLVVNVYPTLDKHIPSANNKCVELTEGQSTEFTCIYNASTDPNITITTWEFNEVLLEHNSSHYTMTTQYGNDPANINRVLSRIVLSNVKHDNAGTYICQCAYNPKVIVDDKDVVSEAASVCLKVKSAFPWWLVIVGAVMIILIPVVLLILYCCWKRRKKKPDQTPEADDINEHTRLLINQMMINLAGDHSINNQNRELNPSGSCRDVGISSTDTQANTNQGTATAAITNLRHSITKRRQIKADSKQSSSKPLLNGLSPYSIESQPDSGRKPTANTSVDDASSTGHAKNQDKLISGQDPHSPTASLIPNHQRSHRQCGDMVTGANVTGEVHVQLPAHSTSLESFKSPSGNGHVDQPVASKQLTKLPTNEPIGSEAEVPRIPHPAPVRPAENEPVVQPSSQAKNSVPSTDCEKVTAKVSTGCCSKILDSIAPEFNNVNMVSLFPYLRQHHLVTRDEEHHLSIEGHSDVKKAQLLLGYLKTKGDESLQKILCCLNLAHEHSGHKDIAVKLKQKMEANNIKCADFCAKHSSK